MTTKKTLCCNSQSQEIKLEKSPSAKRGLASFFSTLLIIVLPKCPFCVAAYSGAILMFFDLENKDLVPFFLHAKPVLGVIIIALIVFNYNVKKSKIALSVASIAFVLLILSTYYYITIVPDIVIYIAFLFAAWYNGNFKYFYKFLKSKLT